MNRFREHLVWPALGLLFFLAAATAWLVWPSTHARHAAGPVPLSSTGVFDPAEAMFGDQVTARLDVIGGSGLHLTPEVNFSPYEVESVGRSIVALGHSRTLYRFQFELSCLRTACQIQKGARFFRFGKSVVRSGDQLTETAWPTLPVITRAGLGPLQPLRTNEAATVPVRGPDTHAAWIAWAAFAAVLAALASLWLPTPRLGRRATPAPEPVQGDHLAAALRLAHVIAEIVSVERLRSSLEDVADELVKSGRADVARRVRTLAWAEADPTPAQVAELVGELERTRP